MTDKTGFIEVTDIDGVIFTDSKRHDFIVFTETSNQNILLGTTLSNNSALSIRNNNIHINNKFTGGNGSNVPNITAELVGDDAILIPKGTTGQRPTNPQQGYIRYNTSINTFEGYGAGNAWGSLGGVKDTNQDTYISAESYPSSNDDTLRFLNSNNETMRITVDGRIGISNEAPSERLEVSGGNAKFNSNLYILERLGIAHSNPTERLDIQGNVKISENLYIMSNIGIGLSNPSTSLEVNGGVKVRSNVEILGDLTIRGTTTTVDSTTVNIVDNIIRLNNGATFSSGLQAGFEVNRGTGYSNYLVVFDETTDTLQTGFQGALQPVPNMDASLVSNGVLLYDNTNKKITSCNSLIYSGFGLGIGTMTPTEQLDINKNAKINSNLYVLSNLAIGKSNPTAPLDLLGNAAVDGTVTTSKHVLTRGLQIKKRYAGYYSPPNISSGVVFGFSNDENGAVISITSNASTNYFKFLASSNEVFRITGSGNVGIYTSNPLYPLDINGTLNATTIYENSTSLESKYATSNGIYPIAISASNRAFTLFETSNNCIFTLGSNLGLNTSNPQYTLDINGNINASSNIFVKNVVCNDFTVSNAQSNTVSDIVLLTQSNNISVGANHPWHSECNSTFIWNSTNSHLRIGTNGNERMRILNSGNIGMNTTTPASSLTIVGNLAVGSNTSAQSNGLFVLGNSTFNSNVTVQGTLSIMNSTVYNVGSAGWYIIGYWDCSSATNSGAKAKIRILACNGYDGTPGVGTGKQGGGETTIYMCNLNNLGSASAVNIDGSWKHEGGDIPFTSIKVVQNGSNRSQYFVYANVTAFTQHSVIAETNFGTTFTTQFTSTTDPGANSATVQSLPLYTNLMSGNLGIGTSNPVFKMHSTGSLFLGNITYASTTIPAGSIGNLTPANGIRLVFDNSFNGTAGQGMAANKIVLHNNNWLAGFGLESGAVTYHSGGNHNFYTATASAYGNLRLSIADNGTRLYQSFWLNDFPNGTLSVSGTQVISSSDRRIKSNIEYITQEDSISKIMSLKPATFEFNLDPGVKRYGFIAQDVETIIPEAVDGKKYDYYFIKDNMNNVVLDENGDPTLDTSNPRYRGLDHNAILANLVSAFQQYKQHTDETIKALQERLSSLEAQ